MVIVVGLVCPTKEFVFAVYALLSVVFFICPANTHVVGELIVEKTLVDFLIPTLQSRVRPHCLSPSPPRVSRAFGQGIYGTKKAQAIFSLRLVMNYL
jgi:hypothetical protein